MSIAIFDRLASVPRGLVVCEGICLTHLYLRDNDPDGSSNGIYAVLSNQSDSKPFVNVPWPDFSVKDGRRSLNCDSFGATDDGYKACSARTSFASDEAGTHNVRIMFGTQVEHAYHGKIAGELPGFTLEPNEKVVVQFTKDKLIVGCPTLPKSEMPIQLTSGIEWPGFLGNAWDHFIIADRGALLNKTVHGVYIEHLERFGRRYPWNPLPDPAKPPFDDVDEAIGSDFRNTYYTKKYYRGESLLLGSGYVRENSGVFYQFSYPSVIFVNRYDGSPAVESSSDQSYRDFLIDAGCPAPDHVKPPIVSSSIGQFMVVPVLWALSLLY